MKIQWAYFFCHAIQHQNEENHCVVFQASKMKSKGDEILFLYEKKNDVNIVK